MKKLIPLIILTFGYTLTLIAQPNPGVTNVIRESITNKVNALYGSGMYDLNTIDIINIDSSLTPNKPLEIQDPYHTLEHCFVFLASGKMQADGSFPKGFVGVYRDGDIIWHSSAIINSNGVIDAEINPILDMNNNGKVDIVTKWKEGVHGAADYIWIFSWDGNKGVPLNLYDSNGQSNLVSYADEENFVDLEGNGILGIKGKWQTNNIPSKDISVLYAWNGKNYVSVDTSSYAKTIALPRNKIHAIVSASVTQGNDSLYFSYILKNKNTSLQKIETFAIRQGTNSISYISGRKEWIFDVWTKQPLLSWDDVYMDNLLPQGEMDIYKFSTTALPKIEQFYIQGYNSNGDLSDIFTNSLHGFTIGPSDPPTPFIPLNFLDTLISFKHRSVSLGWINNKGIANSLDSKLDNAKKKFSSGNMKEVKNILNAFLNEVEAQKGKYLSSEAYALLKYNAKYLIDSLK